MDIGEDDFNYTFRMRDLIGHQCGRMLVDIYEEGAIGNERGKLLLDIEEEGYYWTLKRKDTIGH